MDGCYFLEIMNILLLLVLLQASRGVLALGLVQGKYLLKD